MYKVFIVDDEEFVIKSLIGSIDWMSFGFEVCGYAQSGKEALEKLKEIHADIVFTDVQMAGMSGIELIKILQKQKNSTLFVVISGYAEFAYAQKAMEFGAIGYCLKPFDEDEIGGYLKKAAKILDSKQQMDTYNLAERLLTADDNQVVQIMEKGELSFETGVTVISIIGDGEFCRKIFQPHLLFKTGMDQGYLLVNAPKEKLSEISQEVLKILPEDVQGIGISNPAHSPEDMRNEILNAEILSFSFFFSGKKVYDYRQIELFAKGDEFIEKLFDSLRKNFNSLSTFIPSLLRMAEDGNISICHAFRIYNFIVSFLDNTSVDEIIHIYNFRELTHTFSTFSKMLEELSNSAPQETPVIGHNLHANLEQILNYVSNHYCEDVTVQQLSERFYLSAGYICQMIKKQMGCTLTQYIVSLRMEQAKKLLEEGKLQICDIAQQCGYKDYFYFIRIFKKQTGISPGQYRNNHETHDVIVNI